MIATEATPRVNFEMLQQYINKRVLLVAQVGTRSASFRNQVEMGA